jgi:DNA-binding NarL/FixJ family response regulator
VNKVVNILIIEPSPIIFEGLYSVLSKPGNNLHVYRTETLEETDLINKHINLVILNPSMIQNNLKSFNNLKNNLTDIKWVALVYAYFDQHLLTNFDAVINISDSTETIVHQIKQTLNSEVLRESDSDVEVLSDRETDVLKLLATGLSNKEIADVLNISINTVITHRKNISQKTGIKSVSGLTIYAVVKKLITIENINE